MPKDVDPHFYDRADAHIHLSNDQLSDISSGKVSASMMYGTSRFNAWVSACGHASGDDMAAAKEATLNYFVEQYRLMLEENYDDYAENFEKYMRAGGEESDEA